jgi:hypothetical protein
MMRTIFVSSDKAQTKEGLVVKMKWDLGPSDLMLFRDIQVKVTTLFLCIYMAIKRQLVQRLIYAKYVIYVCSISFTC